MAIAIKNGRMNDRSEAALAVRPSGRTGADALPDLVGGTAAVREGRLKPSEWLESCLARIELCEPLVGAFAHIDPDWLRSRAAEMDAVEWPHLSPPARLAGAPLAIKDIFNTRNMPNSMGSDIRRGYQPGNDARVLESALHLGALPVGKTTTAEFAVHSSPETRNPWGTDRIAGTSSTGSSVAVACGMVPAAFGTQSAGSITRPASYNGVVGFKPTFGLIPRTGILKTCDTLDTIGWLTRNVADARLLFDCLRVRGHNYPQVVRGFRASAAAYPKERPWRIGHGPAPAGAYAKDHAREALDLLALQLSNRGDVELVELDLATPMAGAHEVHQVIYHKSLAYYFMRDLAHIDRISELFRHIVDQGERYSTEEYLEALTEQERLMDAFNAAMDGVDVFLSLSTAGEAPPLEEVAEPRDASLVWTLCGAPSISLPLFHGETGLPFGAQLAGRRYHDYALLDFAESVFPGDSPLATPHSG